MLALNRKRLVLVVTGILLVLVVQRLAIVPSNTMLAGALQNSLHVPMFVVVTAMLWYLFEGRWLWVLAVALCVAFGSEVLQISSSRVASLLDVAIDSLGILVGLAGCHWLALHRDQPVPVVVGIASLTALLTLAWPTGYAVSYQHRDSAFPILLEPGDLRWRLLTEFNSQVISLTGHELWPAYRNKQLLHVTWSDRSYPGITLHEVVPNWGTYTQLTVDLFVLGEEPMQIFVAVKHEQGTSRHVAREVSPGAHVLRIPIVDLAYAHTGDEANVTKMILHTNRTYAKREILLGVIRLE